MQLARLTPSYLTDCCVYSVHSDLLLTHILNLFPFSDELFEEE